MAPSTNQELPKPAPLASPKPNLAVLVDLPLTKRTAGSSPSNIAARALTSFNRRGTAETSLG